MPVTPRERFLLDPGWRFRLGDVAGEAAISHGDTYSSVMAGAAAGPAGLRYDDRAWRTVDLPHDWLVELPYDPTANVSHSFRRGGVAWYRKTFDLPADDLGRRLALEFDGVFRDSTVWLNGHRLGSHRSGYTSFRYDLTEVANYGGPNVLAVRVDATEVEGWWYEGAGIYRHVWLTKTSPLHVAHWGVFVSATVAADGTALVRAQTTVENRGATEAAFELTSVIVDPDGREVGRAVTPHTLPADDRVEVCHEVGLDAPALWDLESPHLYRLQTVLRSGGAVADECATPFGIRTIRFDPEQGFFLNGRPLKLKGTCNHQDHAGVGVAVPDAVQEFRVRRLKAMGCNAWRTAHNPPTPELLEACDRLGMLVMAENRHLDSSREGLADLESLIRRDRNHPSVIIWSTANEEPLQGSDVGARIAVALNRLAHRLDPTRPTIAAMNGGWGGAFSRAHDLQGCNYSLAGYDDYHAAHPDHPMLGSETTSALSTRGIYAVDAERGYLSAYDVHCPEWGSHAETAWRAIADRPFMAGAFVWTGFDYRGEPQPYEWPCINSAFGILDTCGFPKDSFFYYQSWWSDRTVLHLFPHWTWPERVGETVAVWCYSNCEAVELFLNGESLGRLEMPRHGHLEWSVPYAPGTLTARGFSGGAEVATTAVETSGPAMGIRLTPDRLAMNADGEDACVVAVSVHDDQGRVVPIADSLIRFAVSENATILGVGNGDPSSHEPDKANRRRAFNGWCQVIVRSKRGAAGEVELTAASTGLRPARLALQALPCEPRLWL